MKWKKNSDIHWRNSGALILSAFYMWKMVLSACWFIMNMNASVSILVENVSSIFFCRTTFSFILLQFDTFACVATSLEFFVSHSKATKEKWMRKKSVGICYCTLWSPCYRIPRWTHVLFCIQNNHNIEKCENWK